MLKILTKKSLILLFIFIIPFTLLHKTHANYNSYNKVNNKKFSFIEEIEEKLKYSDEFEIESLRTISSKHFRLSDGTYKVVSYNKQVHELVNDEWVDIDNTIVDDNGLYHLKNNEKLNICKNTKDKTIINYNNINVSLLNINEIEPLFYNNEKELSSSVIYSNIINNTNLKIDFSYNNMYIDFDIENLSELDSIVFIINKNQNKLSKNVNDCLVLESDDKSYLINKPILFECEDINISYNVSEDDDSYNISFSYDDYLGNLNDIGVGFVCYELLTTGNVSNNLLYDTYVTSSGPTTPKGSDTRMVTYSNNTKFSLIKTDLPNLPSSSTISSAVLSVPYYFYQNSNSYVNVGCYMVNSSWNESSVTWNTKPTISSYLVDSAIASAQTASSSSPDEISFDITDCVDDWFTSRLNNYGIALKYENGTYNEIRFKSKESVTYRSILTIYYTLDTLPVSEGIYFIKNGHLSKYMQVDDNDSNNNYSSNGAKMEIWDFDGEDYQKWNFVYLHNGYYKIINIQSGKELSVDEGYENTANHYLVQETSSGSRRHQWSVTLTSHGMYKIKPRSSIGYSTDWVMCIGEGIGGNGRNVEQREYSNNTIYKDEWTLLKLEFKYVNYYDSTFVGNSFLINNIVVSNDFSNLVFERLYSVNMIMNGSSTQFINAVADGCSHSPNVPCSLVDCGLDCSYHHRNYHNMSNQIYNNGILNNHIYIMWSDRTENTYCHKDSSGNHETVTAIACVCDSRPIILFLRISGSDSNQKTACMALNIVHESAHTFGMDDVYDVPGHDVNGAYVCIMERFERSYAYKFYQDIMLGSADPFCSTCKSAIEALIYQDIIN